MNSPIQPAGSQPIRPLRPIEHQLIRAQVVNAHAVTAPGVIVGNRAFVRSWEARRSLHQPERPRASH